jgi:hypothetical protein
MVHVVQPTAHPQRIALHNEVHARPPDAMTGPLTDSHLVMFAGPLGLEFLDIRFKSTLGRIYSPIATGSSGDHMTLDRGRMELAPDHRACE